MALAEDQEFVRRAIAGMIRAECQDFDVTGSYADGVEALADFEQVEPDIVVTDIKMPRMDGLHLAKVLHERYPRVKVVILSGYGEFEYARKALSYGVSEYLLKPCRPEDLYGALRAAAAEIEEYRSLSRLAVRSVDNPETADEQAGGAESDADLLLGRAVSYIREKYWTDLSLDEVARSCYLSGRHLSRLLSEKLGLSFTTLVTDTRMERARELLRDPSYRVQEVAALVGYNDYRYFNYVFKKTTGQTPTGYRRGQRPT